MASKRQSAQYSCLLDQLDAGSEMKRTETK